MQFHAYGYTEPGTSSQEVFDVQAKLRAAGYHLDQTGAYDAATSAAVLDFRSKAKLPVVDVIDDDLKDALGAFGGGSHMMVAGVIFAGVLAWAIWG